jgi:hypothetical protein
MFGPLTVGIRKFGRNPDFDTGAAEDVWSHGGLYTYDTGAVQMYLSSSDNSDTQVITVEGLDATWRVVVQSKALTGQTQVALDTELIRVYRAYCGDATPTAGDVYVALTDAASGGVPAAGKVRAKIDIAAQQTLMAITSVPAFLASGNDVERAYIAEVSAVLQGGTPAAAKADVGLFVREFGGVFLQKDFWTLDTNGGNVGIDRKYLKYIEVDPKADVVLRALTTDKDNIDIAGGFTIFFDK